MNNYKAIWFGLIVLVVQGMYSHVNATNNEVSSEGVYMYAQPTRASRHTTLQIAPADMIGISLGCVWLKAAPKKSVPRWMALNSVEVLGHDRLRTMQMPVLAYLSIPSGRQRSTGHATRLPAGTKLPLIELRARGCGCRLSQKWSSGLVQQTT
jgi:hypothetical protein